MSTPVKPKKHRRGPAPNSWDGRVNAIKGVLQALPISKPADHTTLSVEALIPSMAEKIASIGSLPVPATSLDDKVIASLKKVLCEVPNLPAGQTPESNTRAWLLDLKHHVSAVAAARRKVPGRRKHGGQAKIQAGLIGDIAEEYYGMLTDRKPHGPGRPPPGGSLRELLDEIYWAMGIQASAAAQIKGILKRRRKLRTGP